MRTHCTAPRRFPIASPVRVWAVCAAVAALLLGLLALGRQHPAAAQKTPWHLEGWKYRMPVQVFNASAANRTGVLVALNDFPFLTLMNEGKLTANARDLRLVDTAGKAMPIRAEFLLNDEGRARLAFYVPEAPAGECKNLWLYYGNPQAPPAPALDAHDIVEMIDGVGASFGLEQGLTPEPAADAGAHLRWLAGFRVLEAETGTLQGAATLVEPRASLTENISGGRFIAFQNTTRGSLTITGDVEAGETACWVRYCPSTVNKATQGKLTVTITQNGNTLAEQSVDLRPKAVEPDPDDDMDPGDDMKRMLAEDAKQEVERTAYRWLPLRVTFATGAATVTVSSDRTQAGVDCVLLTKNFAYQPDARDFLNRVWIRWRLTAPTGSIFTNIDNQISYGRNGAVMRPTGDIGHFGLRPPIKQPLAPTNADYLNAGEFSPWVLLPTSNYDTWFTVLTFSSPPGKPLVKNAPIEMQFATRPSLAHVFHITRDEKIDTGTVKVRMPTETTLAGLNKLESFGEWAQRRLAIVKDLKLGPPPRLKRLRVHVWAFTGTPDTPLDRLHTEFSIMEELGFNSVYGSHLPDATFAELAKAHGMVDTYCVARAYPPFIATPSTWKGDADLNEWFDRMITKSFEAFCKSYKRDNPFAASIATRFDIGDEIGPMVEAKGILASPPVLQDFREFLKKRGLTPQTFGMTKWEDVNPTDDRKILGLVTPGQKEKVEIELPPDDPDLAIDPAAGPEELKYPPAGSLAAAKLFYYTRRYIDYYSGCFYKRGTDVLAKEFPKHRIISPNYQAGPMQMAFIGNNNDTDKGLLDIFQFARDRVFRGLQMEDWVHGTNHGVGREALASEIMRSAARKHNDHIGSLQVGGESIKHEMMAYLMHGVKENDSYLYGPLQNIGPAWGEYQHSNASVAEFTREIKRVEDAIADGNLRPRKAAMLVAYTSDVMQIKGVYHCWLRQNSFIALAHGYVPVDVINEQEILEDDILKHYSLIFVTDPQTPLGVHQKLAEWVKRGGRLWAGVGGANWDEFNQRCTVLDDVFGVAKREMVAVPAPEEKDGPGTVITADSPHFGGKVTLPVWDYMLDCQPTTAQVLGSYADGKPAVLLNKYGQGEAMLVGAPVGTSYLKTHFKSNITDPAWSFERGTEASRLLSGLVAGAKVERPVVLDVPGIYTSVWDAPQGTLVFFNNATYAALWYVKERRPAPQVTARIRVPGPIKTVTGKNGELKFTQQGNEVTVQLTVPDTDILLLK